LDFFDLSVQDWSLLKARSCSRVPTRKQRIAHQVDRWQTEPIAGTVDVKQSIAQRFFLTMRTPIVASCVGVSKLISLGSFLLSLRNYNNTYADETGPFSIRKKEAGCAVMDCRPFNPLRLPRRNFYCSSRADSFDLYHYFNLTEQSVITGARTFRVSTPRD
jgi:hypothetical protein